MNNKHESLLTVREVAERMLLGYKARTIRQLIKKGEIRIVDVSTPGAKRPAIRIPESAITEFLESRKAKPAQNADETPLD